MYSCNLEISIDINNKLDLMMFQFYYFSGIMKESCERLISQLSQYPKSEN